MRVVQPRLCHPLRRLAIRRYAHGLFVRPHPAGHAFRGGLVQRGLQFLVDRAAQGREALAGPRVRIAESGFIEVVRGRAQTAAPGQTVDDLPRQGRAARAPQPLQQPHEHEPAHRDPTRRRPVQPARPGVQGEAAQKDPQRSETQQPPQHHQANRHGGQPAAKRVRVRQSLGGLGLRAGELLVVVAGRGGRGRSDRGIQPAHERAKRSQRAERGGFHPRQHRSLRLQAANELRVRGGGFRQRRFPLALGLQHAFLELELLGAQLPLDAGDALLLARAAGARDPSLAALIPGGQALVGRLLGGQGFGHQPFALRGPLGQSLLPAAAFLRQAGQTTRRQVLLARGKGFHRRAQLADQRHRPRHAHEMLIHNLFELWRAPCPVAR